MSPAAQSRAKAEARLAAEVAASAEAKAVAPNRQVRISPARSPEDTVPSIDVRRVSPAAQRRSFLIASTAGGVLAASGIVLNLQGANDDGAAGRELEGEAAKVMLQLQEDRRRLKAIQSIERKIEAKRTLLPAYDGWCDGVIAAGKADRVPLLDELFTTIMAWRIDVGDYLAALTMAEHAFRYDLPMPERFKRTTACFVVEQFSDAAITAYDTGGDAATVFPAAVLPMLQDLVETYDEDLHDEVSAKLQRAIGMAILAGADIEDEDDLRARREQTLKCYLRALQLDARVGVKKQVEQLQRQLKAGTPPPPPTDIAPPPPPANASSEADAAEPNTPPSDEAG